MTVPENNRVLLHIAHPYGKEVPCQRWPVLPCGPFKTDDEFIDALANGQLQSDQFIWCHTIWDGTTDRERELVQVRYIVTASKQFG